MWALRYALQFVEECLYNVWRLQCAQGCGKQLAMRKPRELEVM
jgi:hypothetical protein